MPHKLFLLPNEPYRANDSQYDWVLYDLKGLKVAGGKSSALDQIQQILMQNGAESVKAVLVWPGNLSFFTRVTVPGKSARFLQQALAFAVEDKVATDIELLHFATSKGTSKSSVNVHCIEKALLLGFYDDVAGAKPEIILNSGHVDADLLPLETFDTVVSLDGEWALVRSEGQSLRIQTQNLTPLLDSIFLTPSDEAEQTHRVKVFDHNNGDSDHKILLAELEQYPGVELEVESLGISLLELLAESYFHSGAPSIDLCQGDLRIQAEGGSNLRQWAWVAGIAALAFFIQLGVFVGKGMHYQAQADDFGQQALAAYQQAVPSAQNVSVSRLARIIKGKLRESKSSVADAGFMTLLGEAGYQYQQRKKSGDINFTAISYSAQRGELVVELRAKTFEQMDQLKNAIIKAGLTAKISSAVQEDQYFRGRLSVSQS